MSKKNKNRPSIPQIATPPMPISRPATVTPATPAAQPVSQQMPTRQSSTTSSANRPTLEQQRAAHALDQIEKVKGRNDAGDYKSYAESLPATIVMNGLGQACATLLAQARGESSDKDAHRRLYDHLEDWLCGSEARVGVSKPLIEALVESDQSKYCHAQAEALAYLVWLKKFAQAFLSRGGSENG